MKAATCKTVSTAMAVAMTNPEYQEPPKVMLLESPNTLKQRQLRENFYQLAGRKKGIHVKF